MQGNINEKQGLLPDVHPSRAKTHMKRTNSGGFKLLGVERVD